MRRGASPFMYVLSDINCTLIIEIFKQSNSIMYRLDSLDPGARIVQDFRHLEDNWSTPQTPSSVEIHDNIQVVI